MSPLVSEPAMPSFPIALLLSILAFAARAGETAPDLAPSCGGVFQLCGFVDRTTKAEVLPPRYERAFAFSEGLAGVRMEGRWGFVNEKGEVIVRPKFDLVGDFYQGLAEALLEGKTGVIDRTGRYVVEPQFARAVPFTRDTLLVEEGLWRSIHFSGYERLDNAAGHMLAFHGPVGLYHVEKGWIVRPRFRHPLVFETEGRGLVWAKDENGRDYGLLAADGSWRIKPRFAHAASLMDGLATVYADTPSGNGRGERLIGAVDANGELVVPLEARWIGYWRNGFGLTSKDGKEGFLDKQGRLIGGRYFDKVERPEKGDVARVLDKGRWAGLTRSGDIVPDPRDGEVIMACPTGVAFRRHEDRLQIVGGDGEPTTALLFDAPDPHQVHRREDWCAAPHPVAANGKATFVGLDGRLFQDPPGFEAVRPFAEGVAPVKLNGKWGLIDLTGKFVVEPRFGEVKAQHAGLVAFLDGEKIVWLNAAGETQPEPAATGEAVPPEKRLACPGGGKRVTQQGLWGVAMADGTVVIPPIYRAINCFKDGVAYAPFDRKRQWCPIGPDGAPRENGCRQTHYPYIQTHSHPESLDPDAYESSVLWSRAFLEYLAGTREEAPKMLPDGGGMGTHSILR